MAEVCDASPIAVENDNRWKGAPGKLVTQLLPAGLVAVTPFSSKDGD